VPSKVLVLSAYDAPSHRFWHQGLRANLNQHQWQVLAMPPRYFSWRMRGNSLNWALDPELNNLHGVDCLIATSMVDLASLRGMLPTLARLPTALYFHENQFAYPESESQTNSLEPKMVQLYSAIAADRLVFNSVYNRDTFLSGVADMLGRFPDFVPDSIPEMLASKSECIPVPIELSCNYSGGANYSRRRNCSEGGIDRVQIVWNHRWEYDKGPDLLLSCIQSLPEHLYLTFNVVGQSFRHLPPEFKLIKSELEKRSWLGAWGYIKSREEYLNLLGESHIVLSTSKHDFQGLSVLEAVAAGCLPVLPKALAYPEWFSGQFLYSCQEKTDAVVSMLSRRIEEIKRGPVDSPNVKNLSWQSLRGDYENLVSELSNASSRDYSKEN